MEIKIFESDEVKLEYDLYVYYEPIFSSNLISAEYRAKLTYLKFNYFDKEPNLDFIKGELLKVISLEYNNTRLVVQRFTKEIKIRSKEMIKQMDELLQLFHLSTRYEYYDKEYNISVEECLKHNNDCLQSLIKNMDKILALPDVIKVNSEQLATLF